MDLRVDGAYDVWGDGPGWDAAYEYCARAWSAQVPPHLLYRFDHGPIDWARPPEVSPIPGAFKLELVAREP